MENLIEFQVWRGPEEETLSTRQGCLNMLKMGTIGPDANLILRIFAPNYVSAMTVYHEKVGREPYRPFPEDMDQAQPEKCIVVCTPIYFQDEQRYQKDEE